MINADKVFKEANSKFTYADITLKDGTVLNLGPSDFILGGFSLTDETTTGKFGLGNTSGKTISITIANHTDKFSVYDFYKATVLLYIGVKLPDRTPRIAKGLYHVISPSSPGETINLSCVDSMYLFDKEYNADTVFPATLQTILSDCCIDCGVPIGFQQFDNYDFVVNNKPTDCTYRQVVSWCAQIAGYNARIDNNGYFNLVWYNTDLIEDILKGGNHLTYDEENEYDGGDFSTYSDGVLWDGGDFTDPSPENINKIKNIKVSTDDVVITGVCVKYDDVTALYGEEGYTITISDNEFVDGKEEEVAEYLGRRLMGLQFRPLSCEIANNPLIEPFDICYVYDRKGNSYLTFINSVNYSISGFTTIACKAEDPIRNESTYASKEAQAVVKVKKEVKKELTTYDKAVQNMNMLAANAMGLYRESEVQIDGSIIYYQSNKPIYKNESGKCEFVTNSVVYKMTGNGFFVSTDGGLSYTSGFDSQGNAVVNVLSAIGITFDWAKGGTLTLGGANNVSGSLQVLDQNGAVIGKWDKDGITVSGSDAKISKIAKDTISTPYLNSLGIKAGSVDAENITGTTISGKQIKGSVITIGDEGKYYLLSDTGISLLVKNGIFNDHFPARLLVYKEQVTVVGKGITEFEVPSHFPGGEAVVSMAGITFGVSEVNVNSQLFMTKMDYQYFFGASIVSIHHDVEGYMNYGGSYERIDGIMKLDIMIFA